MADLVSPIVAILRTALTKIPLWEIMASVLLLAIAVWVVIMMAARVFRIGMLMYGKPASLSEIWRWARH